MGVDWITRELVGGDAQTAFGRGRFGQGEEGQKDSRWVPTEKTKDEVPSGFP